MFDSFAYKQLHRRNTSMAVKNFFLICLTISCCQDCLDSFCFLFLNILIVIFFSTKLIFWLIIFSYYKLFKDLNLCISSQIHWAALWRLLGMETESQEKSSKFHFIFWIFLLVTQSVRTRINFLDSALWDEKLSKRLFLSSL